MMISTPPFIAITLLALLLLPSVVVHRHYHYHFPRRLLLLLQQRSALVSAAAVSSPASVISSDSRASASSSSSSSSPSSLSSSSPPHNYASPSPDPQRRPPPPPPPPPYDPTGLSRRQCTDPRIVPYPISPYRRTLYRGGEWWISVHRSSEPVAGTKVQQQQNPIILQESEEDAKDGLPNSYRWVRYCQVQIPDEAATVLEERLLAIEEVRRKAARAMRWAREARERERRAAEAVAASTRLSATADGAELVAEEREDGERVVQRAFVVDEGDAFPEL
ncbi:hypothetical protein DFJ73DRAFT_847442 [Zopfochytrium polystomum]|nr:hypothetical protein DFJ73DRAFT_847442 [Zopfochytrium polystomum]